VELTCLWRGFRDDSGGRPQGADRLHTLWSTTVEEFETLKRLIEEAAEDIQKAEGGNKAAGTRVRKTMQDIKNTAQDVRKRVLDLRSEAV